MDNATGRHYYWHADTGEIIWEKLLGVLIWK